jgi:anti-sigma B factor antagonist
MSLGIEKREREGIVIVDMKGRITMGEEVGAFRQTVQDLAREPNPKIILNMQGVDYIDSTGLGAIVMCSTAVRASGGVAKLLNLNKRNVELLIATKLATIFEIFTTEQDAVNSFFPDRENKGFDILEFVKAQKRG